MVCLGTENEGNVWLYDGICMSLERENLGTKEAIVRPLRSSAKAIKMQIFFPSVVFWYYKAFLIWALLQLILLRIGGFLFGQ